MTQSIQFALDAPLAFLNVKATDVKFLMQYPSGNSYWNLLDENGTVLKEGNHTFSEEVLAVWTDSDDVLINDLKAAEPWIIKPVQAPVEPKAEETNPEPTN